MTAAPPARRLPAVALRAYTVAAGALRSHHGLFRLIFGYRPPEEASGPLWDWTTLQLKRALRGRAGRGPSLLDMGTGPVAVLAVYAGARLGFRKVCAVDHVMHVAAMARRTTDANGLPIDVRHGSLFESVTGRFDTIVFNAPYIDPETGARAGLLRSEEARRRWCGGSGGLETVAAFLSGAHRHLAPEGRVLLGVNHCYVRPPDLLDVIARQGWCCEAVHRSRWTGAAVYALRPARAAGAMHV